jgi:hypothetical protein
MKTVKVRIAVAVDRNGNWSASGYDGHEKNDPFSNVIDVLEPGEARYWVTAELSLPHCEEVQGEVERAD